MATNNALNNSSTSGFSSTGGAFTGNGGAVSIGTDNAANAISIGVGSTARTIGMGNSAAAHVITIGSTTGAASLNLQSGSGNIIHNTGFTINSGGISLNTKQSAFEGYCSTSPTNVTGDATVYVLAINTEIFDQNNDYNNGTFTFTAPVTGKYFFNCSAVMSGVVAQTTVQIQIVTTGNAFNGSYESGVGVVAAGGFLGGNMACFAAMTAADTAQFKVIASGSTKTVGITGGANFTYAGGYLVC